MIDLPKSWLDIVGGEFEKPYMKNLKSFLLSEKQKGFTVFPPNSQIFTAFHKSEFQDVKIVILGQDPYHGAGQAHGLSFSVLDGIAVPPSLQNIYKELNSDIGKIIPQNGNLTSWADQGVFLLNSVLTVRANEPSSHQKQGWEIFTDQVISTLSAERKNLVFMLWGKYAIAKMNLIDTHKHLILTAPHPSPFSAHKGFYGCKHFSQANEYLIKNGNAVVQW